MDQFSTLQAVEAFIEEMGEYGPHKDRNFNETAWRSKLLNQTSKSHEKTVNETTEQDEELSDSDDENRKNKNRKFNRSRNSSKSRRSSKNSNEEKKSY